MVHSVCTAGLARMPTVIDDAPILRPAARVLLIDDQDRVLLRANVGDGDVWITPGGALEPGETAEEAALRELWEETGISDAELSAADPDFCSRACPPS